MESDNFGSRHEITVLAFIFSEKLICMISFRLTEKLTPKRLKVVSPHVNGLPT